MSIRLLLLCWAVMAVCSHCDLMADAPQRPNIVFILADDLGYGDLGCYGQREIRTPHLDRLAAEGTRFTSCYAGSTVCAPSRCTLMTGKHTGHCRIRSNARVPLLPEDITVAKILKQAGYATGIVGKWGLGEPNTSGIPTRQGFDTWFGYLNQSHAHNYYPDYLWRGEQRVELDNVVAQGVASKKLTYAPDLMLAEALTFIEAHQRQPFFLYFASTLPHANNEAKQRGMEVPSDAPYSDRDWPQPQRNHAAMITYLDTQVGQLLDKLSQLGLQHNTIVFFSSDNGPHREGGADPTFFHSSGPLRGIKRDLYEGGIRVPMIVRFPGHVVAGTADDTPWAFWDVLPTLAELAGAESPAELDGISLVPTLLGANKAGRAQAKRDYLYWEFPERGFSQALRQDNWKFIRKSHAAPLELYNLAEDLGESHDLAGRLPEIVAQGEKLLEQASTPSDYLPIDVHNHDRDN